MYTYFYVLNDFGIRPTTLFRLASFYSVLPKDTDVYNPNDPKGYGNSNWDIDYWVQKDGKWERNEEAIVFAWDKDKHSRVDVRLFYGYRDGASEKDGDNYVKSEETKAIRGPDAWTKCRWDPSDENLGSIYKNSVISEWPICYSSEALKFAQSGYLVSIVCVQWADLMICKTRNLSLAQQGMINTMGNFGLFFETSLVAILLYVPALNVALGTRQIPPAHFAVPSFSFFTAIFFYDELRKIWLRGGMVREAGRLKLKGWIVQNTYY